MANQLTQPGNVIEIGPGTGNLTLSLLNNPNVTKLVAIEKDDSLLPDLLLRTNHYKQRFHILNQDATTVNISQIIKEYFPDQKVNLIANLPYNIGTSLIIDLMQQIDYFEKIIIMLQNEVVQRLTALPNTKDYGKLSVLMQAQCNTKKLMTISANNFFPRPKVSSAILSATPHPQSLSPDKYKQLNQFCSTAFRQRRKTLFNNLKGTAYENLLPDIVKIINPNLRVEALDITTVIRLALLNSAPSNIG